MTLYRKLVTTAFLGSLLLLLYITIFYFSSQNSEASSSLSQGITKDIVSFFLRITKGHLTEQNVLTLFANGERILRKGAHFGEYAVMGILTFGILYCYLKKCSAYLFAVIWVAVSAALDEWHQYYVPGRYASVYDVFLDTMGGMSGAFLCCMIICFIQRKKQKKFIGIEIE